jgi:hypothetical protein
MYVYSLAAPASINREGNTRIHFLQFQMTKQRCILISACKCLIHGQQGGVGPQKTHQYNIRYPSKTIKYHRNSSFPDLQTNKRANNHRHINPVENFKAHRNILRLDLAFSKLDPFEILANVTCGVQNEVKCLEKE